MAIVQQGGTSTTGRSSGSTSLVITKPSGVAAGDVLIAGITCDGTTPTPPSGWTEFGGGLHGSATWNNRLYYRVATGSEGANFTWTTGSTGPAAGFINCWRGVDNTNPIDGFIESEGTTSSEPNTGPTATVTVTGGHRMHYIRCVRDSPGNGTATAADMTEADAGASRRCSIGGVSSSGNTSYTIGHFNDDADDSGSGSYGGLAITCDISEDHNYEATYALKAAGTPSSGDLGATLPAVTSSFAATREIPEGAVSATLAPVTSDFTGTAAPPEGPMAASLAPVTAAFAGESTYGSVSTSLAPVTSAFAGSVIPSGALEASLAPITTQFGTETQPFGEHVIRIEAEERAFRVIDDDPGLIAIPRSQVWEQVVPTVNAQAGEVIVSVVANDAAASAPVSVSAGHASVSVSASGATIANDDTAPAGLATATASASAPATSLGVSGGPASASGVANAPLAGVRPLAGSLTASATSYGSSTAVRANAGHVSVSAVVQAATVSASGSNQAPAGHASASATANQSLVAIRALAQHVSVSAAAYGVSSPRGGHASASVTAFSATVTTGGNTNAPAGSVAVSAAANQPLVAAKALAQHVAASVAASGATTPIQALSGLARARVREETLLKYAASVGNGTNTSYVVAHNFGSRDVIVRVYDNTTYEEVQPKVTHTDTNNVTVEFAAAPASNAYRVVVLYSNV